MKKINGALLILISACVLTSCGNDKTTTTDSSNTSTMNVDSGNNSTMLADTGMHNTDHSSGMTPAPDLSGTAGPSNFTSTAASGGMMEVEAATIAQKNATSKEVKDLATMILNDHKKANAELKKIADGKSLAVPAAMTSEHQSHVEMLRSKTGADFDAAYLRMMDEDHTKDIELFRQASTTLTDAELKAFASKCLPVLQKHSDKVKAILAKM